MNHLPPTEPGTVLRILATSDLGATFVPMPTSFGESGTCAGIVELLEREIERQPTIWLDARDLVVGSPMHPLHGIRPWEEVAGLPIAVAAAGNHEFDDGLPALQEALGLLGFPVLCANADVGLPASAMVDSAAGPLGVIGLTFPPFILGGANGRYVWRSDALITADRRERSATTGHRRHRGEGGRVREGPAARERRRFRGSARTKGGLGDRRR